MELGARKKAILTALIQNYIHTGEPVGSKALREILNTELSPATLRNEMSELGEMGYLRQPHTSAGRVPTNAAYRLYVKSLMEHKDVPPSVRGAIDSMLSEAARDPEKTAPLAGEMLSELTGLPSLMTTVRGDEAKINRIEILPMGRRTLLIALITSEGASSRICRSGSDLTPSAVERFQNIASSKLVGLELSDLTPALLQSLSADTGEHALFISPLMSALFAMAEEIGAARLTLRGGRSRLSICDDESDARRLDRIIMRQDTILPILAGMTAPVDVLFGDDTGIDELGPSCMVVAKYRPGGNGRIGVIGPTRMAYDQLVPSLEYFAAKLSQLMAEVATDMEE